MARAVADMLAGRVADGDLKRSLLEVWLAAEASRDEVIECARILLEDERLSEAEMLYGALTQRYPDDLSGHAGLAQIAMRRQLWAEALERWNALLARFGGTLGPILLAMRARALAELGLEERAAEVYANLQRSSPSETVGLLGVAQLAMRRADWPRALAAWNELLARFADRPGAPSWRINRATCLWWVDRAVEAEEALREEMRADAGDMNAFHTLLQLLVGAGRFDEAHTTLEESVFSASDNPLLTELRINILTHLGRLADARSEYERALATADDLDLLLVLFTATPALFQGWPRTQAWIVLREKVERRAGPDPAERPYAARVLLLRLHLALRDHGRFLSAARGFADGVHLGPHDRALRAVSSALADPAYPDWRKPKVFGIGLSKTGTTSLTAALNLLGLNAIHFLNPITGEMMSEEDLYLFDAFTDTPVCIQFEKYYHLFPQSKFIYTVRPPEDWLESISRHWLRKWGLTSFDELKINTAKSDVFHHGTAFRDIQQALYSKYSSFEEAYSAHDLRVRQFFADKPTHQFLEFDIFSGDAWPKLSRFLGLKTPRQPFPWQNRDPGVNHS